jgi:hypothetical protein
LIFSGENVFGHLHNLQSLGHGCGGADAFQFV